ncbi:MAG: hypothetical protein COA57_13855 [Flavobacteriales bacterium]|nr:MAG: hypothetical protein COA57_13855 [Flavobacteriales bacterium]
MNLLFISILCCLFSLQQIEEPGTKYRKGDYIIYEYYGAYRSDTITLTEKVLSQHENHIVIQVTLENNHEKKIWKQYITDTPENQRNNIIDSLKLVTDHSEITLKNKNNKDLYELYKGTYINPDTAMTLSEKWVTDRNSRK